MMPSRVIHIRLDDWVLLGCHDVLKVGGKDTTNLPLGTVVRETITAVIRKMQYDDRIPTYSQEDLMNRITEFYEDDIMLEDVFNPDELFSLGETPEHPMVEIAQAVAKQIAIEGEPKSVIQDVKIGKKTKKKSKKKSIDIFKTDSKSFKEIQIKAPKDRFVEQALETEDDVFKKAVAIAYTNLDRDLWGSAEAEVIIGDLIASHKSK